LPRAFSECLLGLWRVDAVQTHEDLSHVDENGQCVAITHLHHAAGEVGQRDVGSDNDGDENHNCPHQMPPLKPAWRTDLPNIRQCVARRMQKIV
jgi:hypothetical protein